MESLRSNLHRKDRPVKMIWPSIILSVIFWVLLSLLVFFVDPARVADFGIPGSYLLFFGLVFMAGFYTVGLMAGSSRRGLLTATGLAVFLFFRLKGIGTVINLILLAGLLLALDRYLITKS